MKKLFAIGVVVIFFAWFFRTQTSNVATISPAETPTPSDTQHSSVAVDGKQVNYALFVTSPNRVTFIPNFTDKKTSGQLMNEHNCAYGINGGFYDTNNQPLGLFISNFELIHGEVQSALLNGYIGIGANNGSFIGHELLDMHNRITLQTGPLLMANGKPLRLVIRNDEPARRMIAAINTDGSLIFIVLFEKNATFQGPMLAQVPDVVAAINTRELLNISDAINLDGGSASAFYGNDIALSELTSVGSFFCIKEVR